MKSGVKGFDHRKEMHNWEIIIPWATFMIIVDFGFNVFEPIDDDLLVRVCK